MPLPNPTDSPAATAGPTPGSEPAAGAPAAADLAKAYEPAAVQEKWLARWLERGDFRADVDPGRKPHAIMIPLPNVTGALHMGHCLNGTLQDLLTRYRRMQGYSALWMPGTDHAGIATQAVVERRMLEEEKLTRHDVGRAALVERIWKWKDHYEARILGQLRQMGASCDWRRTRFTLDAVCSRAVRRTFFKMSRDGLIYRGQRLVNWDTYLQTAVADDEVTSETVKGSFWTFTYPLVDGSGTIAFSTTRPETMLGDTAVAVHPHDERYRHLVGKLVRIPLNGREIPIIADGLLVDKDLGTGAVKVTPAHDPNDYQCGLRNKLPMINILNEDGTLNAAAGEYAGMDRYEARQKIVEAMAAAGHLVSIEDRDIELKHSDRSKTPIEPFLSDQWFVRMETLAEAALEAVRAGRVKFHPSRYTRTYMDWLGEKRDWCISRQLWWGHQIPVWSRSFADGEAFSPESDLPGPREAVHVEWESDRAGTRTARVCVDDGHPEIETRLEKLGFTRDPDVLDTWFSSALWPHATLGWPDLDRNPPLDGRPDPTGQGKNRVLEYFYPTSVLVTSRDIITLWVARMVITGLYNLGEVPFHHVCVHPKILDGFGQTMSKSKGNGVDPMDLIDKYGTDAVRFTIASLAGENQDVRLPVGYECPHCRATVPQTLEHQKAIPAGGAKPRLKCPACKKESQYTSPWFEPDPGEPVARIVSDRFEWGRNFCNKLWNASRFAMLNLAGYSPGPIETGELPIEDRWILSRLATVSAEATKLLDNYQFDFATRTLRDFTWNEFCDWYLEMIKPRLRDAAQRPAAQRTLVGVLDVLLRLLQPFVPFVTAELWERLNAVAPVRGLPQPRPAEDAAIVAAWPAVPRQYRDPDLEARFARLQETIVAVRNIRAIYGIPPSTPLTLQVQCREEVAVQLRNVSQQFESLAATMLQRAGLDVVRPAGAAAFSLGDADGYIPLEGIIDREAELKRQSKERDRLRALVAAQEKKLSNPSFTNKAPPEVVEQAKESLAGLQKQLESVLAVIAALEGTGG